MVFEVSYFYVSFFFSISVSKLVSFVSVFISNIVNSF
nr:MAG TPA: hypothetical protein [Caudoviricetes sp.]